MSPYSWLLKLAASRQFRKWLITVGPMATKAFATFVMQMRHREHAIRQAEEIKGEFSIATIDGNRHVIVWRDGRPFSSFPPVEGNLEQKLEFYDRERLQRPEDLTRRKAERWFKGRRDRHPRERLPS
jgi:hypothetical protein